MQECVTRYRTVHQTSAYYIFELWTEITTREVFEASWHLVSVMTGRQFLSKTHGKHGKSRQHFFQRFRDTYRNRWIRETSPAKWLVNRFAPSLCHIGTSKNESSIISGGIILGARDFASFVSRDECKAGKRRVARCEIQNVSPSEAP